MMTNPHQEYTRDQWLKRVEVEREGRLKGRVSIMQRIRAMKKSNTKTFRMRKFAREGFHEKTLCPLTGHVLASMIQDDRTEFSRIINDQMIIFRGLVMAATPQYQLIEIAFDDGSAHQLAVSSTIASSLSLQDLENLYASECVEWLEDEASGKGNCRWDLYGKRKPIGYTLCNGDGEALDFLDEIKEA